MNLSKVYLVKVVQEKEPGLLWFRSTYDLGQEKPLFPCWGKQGSGGGGQTS